MAHNKLTTVVLVLLAATATTLGAAAQSECKCELTDCKQATRKVCSVSEGAPRAVCRDVPASEDVIECTQKCFSGHRLAALAVQGSSSSTAAQAGQGRRLLEEDALIIGHDLTVNDSSASQQQAPLEVCSEICRPGSKPTGRLERRCEMVATKQHTDCRTEAVASECVKRCECGGKVIVSRAASSDARALRPALLRSRP